MSKTQGEQVGAIIDRLATKDDVRDAVEASEKRIIAAINANTERLREDLNEAFADQGVPARLKSRPRR